MKHLLGFMATFLAAFLMPENAMASGGALKEVICKIVDITQSGIGKPLASAAIIGVAFMGMFGRVSWGFVLVTVCGIAIIFSASAIVTQITGLTPSCPGVTSGGGSGKSSGKGSSSSTKTTTFGFLGSSSAPVGGNKSSLGTTSVAPSAVAQMAAHRLFNDNTNYDDKGYSLCQVADCNSATTLSSGSVIYPHSSDSTQGFVMVPLDSGGYDMRWYQPTAGAPSGTYTVYPFQDGQVVTSAPYGTISIPAP